MMVSVPLESGITWTSRNQSKSELDKELGTTLPLQRPYKLPETQKDKHLVISENVGDKK